MDDRPDIDVILSAVTCLQSASVTLTEYARELLMDPGATLSTLEEIGVTIAEALVTALDVLPDGHDAQRNAQLRGALLRYLEVMN